MRMLLFIIVLLLLSIGVFAGTAETALDVLGPILMGFVSKYPITAQIMIWVGGLRIIFKPLMSFILVVVETTSGQGDDRVYANVIKSPYYKFFAYLLDWTASIKLPAEEKNVVTLG